jgi:hypothetical protein
VKLLEYRVSLVTTLMLAVSLVIPASAAAADAPTLVDVRAAHYPGYDRLVFEFEGGRPKAAKVRWETDLRLDPSDKAAHVQGRAFLKVRFRQAAAHTPDAPVVSTFGPPRRAFALPNVAHVVLLGDYEGEVSLGVGLMKRTRILKTIELSKPYRFVVHVATRFPKGTVKVFFVDEPALIDGDQRYVVPVTRKVPKGRRAEAALQRLYAGPTQAELDRGLRFLPSRTRGFRNLRINDRGVARVTLKGPCDSGGAAQGTVADQIMPTLKSRPAVKWVKILDRFGQTLQPWGKRDSIPGCLEP